jgi:hypothetical protein
MLIRSGKIQFLFWMAFFAVMLYLWIVAVGVQTFVLPDERPMELPENAVRLMFLLYGLLTVDILAGTIVSAMINNRYYMRFFGIVLMVAFGTFLTAKGMFG